MDAEAERPDLFGYLDHRAFLSDWFTWKKVTNPRFSYRAFARLADQRSPSLLLSVIQGKRNLTDATAQAFCKAMRLTAEERAFFLSLVRLEGSQSTDERNEIWAELSASRRFQAARRVEGASFAYLSRWYIPAIRELANSPHFRAEPGWVAARLSPPIKPAEAAEALQILQHLEMLTVAADGAVTVHDGTVVTPHEVLGLAVHNYHQGMLARATESMTRFPSDARHLGALTVSIPADRVGELKQAIVAFQERLLDLCDSMAPPADRVYQFNMQLFPLSETLQEDKP
jgi:uncharacterized protein (TIGR02147 family)